jgi:poly(A) polymerase
MKKLELNLDVFKILSNVADRLGYPCYVVGGYVRDSLLQIPNDDIDIVVEGSGPTMAKAFSDEVNSSVQIFENYGTAKVDYNGLEVEFVGARKESYQRGSRNPIVEEGTLEDDLLRRDFTINAMAACLNSEHYGEIVDLFNGMEDLRNQVIKTPNDPHITFRDDPLRMLRCIRFATRFGFYIDPVVYEAIKETASELWIISPERITTELMKILSYDRPENGIAKLQDTGLLKLFLPEVSALDENGGDGIYSHKNNFLHSLKVLGNVAKRSKNPWLRLAALLHDIGKVPTKRFDQEKGWTFTDHEHEGARMMESIFRRLRMPLGKELDYVRKLVDMHMRPSMISTRVITDSAVRRLLFDAGDDFDDLMILCESDLTTKNIEKRQRIGKHFEVLKDMVQDLRKRDYVREFQPCINGNDIMEMFGLKKCKLVGDLKNIIKNAVLDGTCPNEPEALKALLIKEYEKIN